MTENLTAGTFPEPRYLVACLAETDVSYCLHIWKCLTKKKAAFQPNLFIYSPRFLTRTRWEQLLFPQLSQILEGNCLCIISSYLWNFVLRNLVYLLFASILFYMHFAGYSKLCNFSLQFPRVTRNWKLRPATRTVWYFRLLRQPRSTHSY